MFQALNPIEPRQTWMLRALTCLISVNPRELSAYLRMECNYFTCLVELVLPSWSVPWLPREGCQGKACPTLHVVCPLVTPRGVPGDGMSILHVVCPLVTLRGVPGEGFSRPPCGLPPGEGCQGKACPVLHVQCSRAREPTL